jgi:hypothetical protein
MIRINSEREPFDAGGRSTKIGSGDWNTLDLRLRSEFMADEKDKPEGSTDPESGEEPYLSPFHKLTKEPWERAMRQGQEDSDSRADSVRNLIEGGGKSKKPVPEKSDAENS